MDGISGADTAWLLISTALVMMMTPALALFYGGLVRQKNVLSTFMHCFFALGIVTIQWVLVGYSLCFAPSIGGVIGNLDFALLRGVGTEAHGTIPHLLFCAYQLMFAIITPALIAGAFAERMKFSAFVLFTVLWTTLVYDPLCHWVWNAGGWLLSRGALDFAGGTVVHASSGISALLCAILVGKRLGYPQRRMLPHDLTMTMIGAGLLWFGWFGFNAGSALASNGIAALALVNTHVAAGAGAVAWTAIDWMRHGKPSALGCASGLVAGLVAITPAAGFVGPVESIVIGLAAGGVCYGAVLAKGRFGYDDALDAFGVHGVGGALGALLTGVLASAAWNPAGADGLIHGGVHLFVENLLALGVTVAYAGVVSFGLLKLVDKLVGLRADPEDEHEGLDTSLHGEEAYGALEGSVLTQPRPERAALEAERAEPAAT
ncbi:MAG: ammonium transporter [Sandaracinus sp.]